MSFLELLREYEATEARVNVCSGHYAMCGVIIVVGWDYIVVETDDHALHAVQIVNITSVVTS